MTIIPVILSGGAGVRLWPLSRQDYPKQLLPLTGDLSLLQQTAKRFADRGVYGDPVVICNDAHRFAIAEQLLQIGIAARIVIEPVGKNTAPAAAVAALLPEVPADAVLLLLPSDHVITHEQAFHQAIASAVATARDGYMVTMGVTPTHPETGFGYIRQGEVLPHAACKIAAFVEKPDAATAQQYINAGTYLWNTGIFAYRPQTLIAELEQHNPAMLAACQQAVAKAVRDLDFTRLDKESFGGIIGDSIDYTVMEKTTKAAVVPATNLGWSDAGSWSALWDIGHKDAAGNVRQGDVTLMDTRNSYVRTHDKQLIATIGVDNLVVVATKDAILIADKSRTQDVKQVVEQLKKQQRSEVQHHRMVYRPWGSYESIDDGDRFQVKRLVVKPGQKLSLQKHFHRAEHWVVVNGTAIVQKDNEEVLLCENESIYLPLGCVHRLVNPGKLPLILVEVQSGSYLGEDDIVRFEDTYGRVA